MSEDRAKYKKELGRVRGVTFTPSVDKNGNLSWSNDGDLDNPDPVNIRGGNGTPGTNGVSATHSWSGTTLTISSASGTSSADLKGEKGDPGIGVDDVECSVVNGSFTFTFTLTEGEPIVVSTTMPEVKGYLAKGQATLNGSGEATAALMASNANYTVLLTPIYNSTYAGQLGELYAYDKKTDGFKIKSTGNAQVSVDWVAFA